MRQEEPNPKPENVTYRLAVDAWLIAVLIWVIVVYIYQGAQLLQAGDQQGWLMFAGLAFVALPIYMLLFPCRYTLTDRNVRIQCGVGNIIEQEIEYAKIQKVSPSWNLLAAPALSIRRVKIRYGDGLMQFALVSPVNRREFMEELNRRRKQVSSEEQSDDGSSHG